ncbi:MAG: DUF5777 family beta-barrel protein [Bacteroidota bacterium]|nr:DUF5777 family beta-barrel protein [Bacteroidota bacterium]
MEAKLRGLIVGLLCSSLFWAQNGSLAEAPEKVPVTATFKGTRLLNYHTIQTLPKNHWEFRVAHRFGDVGSGIKRLWGIDDGARVRLSLDYAPWNFLTLGIERSGEGPLYNVYLKARLLTQTTPGGIPVSVGYYGAVFYADVPAETWEHRLQYLHQLLVARKFSRRFSAQVGLAYLHQNYALAPTAPNDYFLLPLLLRFKTLKRLTIGAEAALPLWENELEDDAPNSYLPGYAPAIGLVIEIETGGHVFQLGVSRVSGIAEPHTLLNRGQSWRFGFNISRIFSPKDPSLQ